MNREQTIAWLILEGWEPRKDSGSDPDASKYRVLRRGAVTLFVLTWELKLSLEYDYDAYDAADECSASWDDFPTNNLLMAAHWIQENPLDEP